MELTPEPSSDEEAGYTMALISAAKRQMKYIEKKLKEYISNGGKVVAGNQIWSEGNNGFRWRKNTNG